MSGVFKFFLLGSTALSGTTPHAVIPQTTVTDSLVRDSFGSNYVEMSEVPECHIEGDDVDFYDHQNELDL